MENQKLWHNQTKGIAMDYWKKSESWKRTCTEHQGCKLMPSPMPPLAYPLETSKNTLNVLMGTRHLVDLRPYPVESHADLLAYFHESLAGHDYREKDGDSIMVVINPMQERCLTIELATQLAERQEFDLIPVLKLQGVCGHPVEVRG